MPTIVIGFTNLSFNNILSESTVNSIVGEYPQQWFDFFGYEYLKNEGALPKEFIELVEKENIKTEYMDVTPYFVSKKN